jgi:hypothetical protein
MISADASIDASRARFYCEYCQYGNPFGDGLSPVMVSSDGCTVVDKVLARAQQPCGFGFNSSIIVHVRS